ncbi:hypothetical protein QFC20_000118 [Naganishia adeliensis]|uniref:Uncharacterized protein n=1 Tax=Naganishia adeliensis TaxID=92952 RepID=A0ACC2X249_9TREE|nr:hypothetical protein QFC20_000118 [Naganishia adeliensis]
MPTGVSAVYRQLLQIVRALPRDPLRPSLQLNETLESAVNRAFGVKQAATATSANEALPLTIAEHVRPEDEALATKALEVLQELKDDKALHAYPLTAKTLQPPTDPYYYTRLIQGVGLSSQGKTRSWWKTFFQVKGEA